MSSLNFHHLRYFWAVAHEGNLTRAAETLNVSQSALSLQIRKLEDRLGHQLFERRGRQLVLSEAGMVALSHADVIFSAGEELLDTLAGREDRRPTLRVGALSTLSRNFQVEFLRPVLGAEDVKVSVRSGSLEELTAHLEAQKLDVVLTNQAPARGVDTPWIVRSIRQQKVSLVGHPHRVRPGMTLADMLAGAPVILPGKQSSIRMGFDALVEELGVEPNILAEVDDMALLRVLARENLGLTVVPPIVVRDELQNGRLTELQELPRLEESFLALTLPRRFPNPALKRVMGAITGGP